MPSGAASTEPASLKVQLALHGKWRARAVRAVHDLRAWLRSAGAGTPEADARLRRALTAIEADGLRIAVAGAEGRGKTELINALFFADFGRRLMPVTATRSLCPLEIRWQPGDGDACLRLLPIEYQADDLSLAELRASPERWVRLPLHPQEPEQISATLAEIHRTKPLPAPQAARLGLAGDATAGATCEVPCWRYAALSFPHPLLKKGLVLLDLPGLAATARDALLQRELLENIDALVLTIAADRGVEADDLTLWQDHLRTLEPQPEVTLVALTRTDLLGPDGPQRATKIERLTHHTATALAVARDAVHAISAREGLAAKIADKPARRRASGVDALESRLGTRIIGAQRERSRAVVEASIGELLRAAMARIGERCAHTDARVRELEALEARSADLVARTLERTRRDEQTYVQSVQQVQRAQRRLRERTARCRGLIASDTGEHLIGGAQARLAASWTTLGLRRAVCALFTELRLVVAQTSTEAAAAAEQVDATYTLLQRTLGLDVKPPPPFSAARYRHEMDLLHAEALRFAAGTELLFTEQGMAIRRLRRGLVQRAGVLLEHLREDCDAWRRGALAPLVAAVEGRKVRAERRLERYQRVKRTREEARAERTELTQQRARLARELTLLRNIRNALDDDPGTTAQRPPSPYLVRSDGEPVRRSG